MNDSMIELVARALWDDLSKTRKPGAWPSDEALWDDNKDKYRSMAIAALTVMQEPTETMKAIVKDDEYEEFAVSSYRAMIGVALSEKAT